MKAIIEIYGVLLMLLLTAASGLSVTAAQEKTAQAKRFKTEVIAEIENSNFNPSVIEGLKDSAAASGYELTVTPCTYDEDNDVTTAEVVLTYDYKASVFGIEETRTTRGIAR